VLSRIGRAVLFVLLAAGVAVGAALVVLGASGASPKGAPPGHDAPGLAAASPDSAGLAVAIPGPVPAAGQPGDRRVVPPLEVAIPRLGVEAPVVEQVGVIKSGPEKGLLSAPADYHVLGWFSNGGTGVLLIDGHVGFAAGAGPLAYIGELSDGDAVVVRYAGYVRTYAVAQVVAVRKGSLAAGYFTRRYTGDVMLITCDYQSPFRDGHFADNIYVLAVPARR
jgi:hypothetical protein